MGALVKSGLAAIIAALLGIMCIFPAFGAEKTVDEYIKEGRDFLQANKIEDALVSFTKALKLDPKSATALFYRGNAFCQQGSYENAIADYTEVIRLDPKNGKAYNNRAVAHWYNNEKFQSQADLSIAESLGAPINKKAWQELMDTEKAPSDLSQFPPETITGVFETKPKKKADTPVKAKP